jgi:pimeloyl-ACP methyl ester carboxylesterase
MLSINATDEARPMARLTVDGVDVLVEGTGDDVLMMIHGWPDTHRLWDAQVAHFRGRFRCVRFTLPGFDLSKPPRAASLAELVALFRAIADAVSPRRPVTLMLHDWGCVFGYEFAARHPGRVARIVSVDVGDYNQPALRRSLTLGGKLGAVGYQVWLSAAWWLGGWLGDRMTRVMAKWRGCPTDPEAIGWQMTYPYAMRWFGLRGGLGQAAPVAPHCPLIYIHGTRRKTKWHSPEWLELLDSTPGCAQRGFDTGHWVMLEQPAQFNRCVEEWLGADHGGGGAAG